MASDITVSIDQLDLYGPPVGDRWMPVGIRIARPKRAAAAPLPDFLGVTPFVPAFGERAVEALRDLLEANGELLPLRCEQGDYYAFNVTRLVEALDVERSAFRRFPDGRIQEIERHVFMPERIRPFPIFKLPHQRRSSVYVTDEFARRAAAAALTGMSLREVWSDSAE